MEYPQDNSKPDRYFQGPESLHELEQILPPGWHIEGKQAGVYFLHPLRPYGEVHNSFLYELINELIEALVEVEPSIIFGEEPRVVSGRRERFFLIATDWPIPNELVRELRRIGEVLDTRMKELGLGLN